MKGINTTLRAVTIKSFIVAACLIWTENGNAQNRIHQPLHEAAWNLLSSAPGVRVDSNLDMEPSIQLICDANCPYCAQLDRTLREKHADLAVRWVPIAYFKPDSASLAAAILASRDPIESLRINYRYYNFSERSGGYQAPFNREHKLTHESERLKRRWVEWGGFTPMVVVRSEDGRIHKMLGSTGPYLEAAAEMARSAAAPPSNSQSSRVHEG